MIEITNNGYYSGFRLEKAEVGDKLMVSLDRYRETYSPVTITKVTKTRITTSDNRQWMIASRRLVGGDSWTSISLTAFDQKKVDDARLENERQDLAAKLRERSLKSLPIEALRVLF